MIYKSYFKRSFVSFLTLTALMGSSEGVFAIGSPRGEDNNEKPSTTSSLKLSRLEAMPDLAFGKICKYLPPQDLCNLRQVSQEIKKKVQIYDDSYIKPLIHQLSTFTPNEIPGNLFQECILRSATERGFCHRLLKSDEGLLKAAIKNNKFLLDRRGSGLSYLLGDTYKRVSFLDFITEDTRADSLFKELFDCDLPKENRDPFINQLAASFPVDAIYFSEDAAKNVTLADFYTNHEDSMLKVIKALRTQNPYFSYGVSDPAKFDDKVAHNIVVSQSQLKDPALNLLLKENHKHTIIVAIENTPNGILSLKKNDIPQNIGKLSLVDTQQICTSIEDNFLKGPNCLSSLALIGFWNVNTIKHNFLMDSKNLTSFVASDLINVKTIKDSFFSNCESIMSLDTLSFFNVENIGFGFLYNCRSLKSLDTRGFFKVKTIGKSCFSNCRSLESVDTRGFCNVNTIGKGLFSECRSLESLDPDGFINLKSIEEGNLLSGCFKLKDVGIIRKKLLERNKEKGTKN